VFINDYQQNALPDWLENVLHTVADLTPEWLAVDNWLRLNSEGGGVGGVWLGRILHTQMSTTSIVETKVSSGVAEIIERLADQGGRLREVG
jgi:hypothetical protein